MKSFRLVVSGDGENVAKFCVSIKTTKMRVFFEMWNSFFSYFLFCFAAIRRCAANSAAEKMLAPLLARASNPALRRREGLRGICRRRI
jgi:hypothetical protein